MHCLTEIRYGQETHIQGLNFSIFTGGVTIMEATSTNGDTFFNIRVFNFMLYLPNEFIDRPDFLFLFYYFFCLTQATHNLI